MAQSTFTHENALNSLLEALDEGAVVFDEGYRCRAAGRRAAELLGLESIVGMERAAVVSHFAAACTDPDEVTAALGDAAVGDASTAVDPILVARPASRVVAWSSVPIRAGKGRAGRIDVLRDVTRERSAEQTSELLSKRLDEVSTVDEPTGLLNRRHFERESEREHRRCQRAWVPYAVLRIRVHQLEAGGARGDTLLRSLGEALRAPRREYDLVARWDDGDLAMLLPGADAPSTSVIAQRCVAIATERIGAESEPAVTIGVAVWIPPSGDGADDMMRRATAALSLALAKGPGAIEIDAGFGQWKDEPAV